jgi:hypothetical protein
VTRRMVDHHGRPLQGSDGSSRTATCDLGKPNFRLISRLVVGTESAIRQDHILHGRGLPFRTQPPAPARCVEPER